MTKNLGSGVLAGVIGGLVGSVALRGWMTAMSQLHKGTWMPDANGPAHQVGAIAAQRVVGHELSEGGRLVAGEVFHYAFGAFTGGIYGGIAEYQPWTTAGMGALFGTGVFAAADESSMPLLKLVPPPWAETPSAQMEHWAAHLVYGLISELTRRSVRRLL